MCCILKWFESYTTEKRVKKNVHQNNHDQLEQLHVKQLQVNMNEMKRDKKQKTRNTQRS